MPEKYVREMFADWMGAGRTIFGRWEVREWFSKNNSKMILHENTRRLIDKIFIEVFDDWQLAKSEMVETSGLEPLASFL